MEKFSTISEDINYFEKIAETQKCKKCGAKKIIRGNCIFCSENCGIIEKSTND